VANVLCVVELRQGRILPVSLEALGQGRRVASRLGATLYALLPLRRAPDYGEEDLIALLGANGADKVLLLTDAGLPDDGTGLLWYAHGPGITTAVDLLPPSLLLFGDSDGAREIAPRVAARIGAAFVRDAWVEVLDERLHLWEGSGEAALGLEDIEYPVVALLPPGRYAPARGGEDAEVEVLALPPQPGEVDRLGWETDPRTRPLILAEGEAAEAAEELALALEGTTNPEVVTAPRLLVSLGPGFGERPDGVRLRLGDGAATDAHYALAGPPAEAAPALTRALDELAQAPAAPADALRGKEAE
jgi:electron transfer flavoprotein alpha subunit